MLARICDVQTLLAVATLLRPLDYMGNANVGHWYGTRQSFLQIDQVIKIVLVMVVILPDIQFESIRTR